MKNQVDILYRYVLENQQLLKDYREGKLGAGKEELQAKYSKLMIEHKDEKLLRSLD
jgi:hypothetical protein